MLCYVLQSLVVDVLPVGMFIFGVVLLPELRTVLFEVRMHYLGTHIRDTQEHSNCERA